MKRNNKDLLLPHQLEAFERLRNLKMPTDVPYSVGIRSLKDFDKEYRPLMIVPNAEMRVHILKQRPVGDFPFHFDPDIKFREK